jgi:archaemetzincin
MNQLRILHDSESEAAVAAVTDALERVFGLRTAEVLLRAPAGIQAAWNARRNQYNASRLLAHLLGSTSSAAAPACPLLSLWLVSADLYVAGMNFVFGVAHPGKGAVLSTARLTTIELIVKEAIHELGHVLGLTHCTNECVMQFSNSLAEAEAKPATLCGRCRARITFL